MKCYAEWEYYIAKDEFQIYFPEGDYDINSLIEWYRTIPTQPEKISYYGDNTQILKRHFENFVDFKGIKTKFNNDMYSNSFLTVWCLAIYNTEEELVGFAAQEYIEDKPQQRKISYFGNLNW